MTGRIMKLTLSPLPKTWVFDVDGTLVKHNGHLSPEGDELLPGVKELFERIPATDTIVLMTARKEENQDVLKDFLAKNNIRFDYLLTDMPQGERILINDRKPSGLQTAYAVNKNRDQALDLSFEIDNAL